MIPEHKIREEIEWLRVRADAAEESRVSISRTAPLNSKIWQGERDGYTNAADRLEALLESEGGEGRGEELELERAFANGAAVQPSYHLQVVESLAERAETAEARAIEAEARAIKYATALGEMAQARITDSAALRRIGEWSGPAANEDIGSTEERDADDYYRDLGEQEAARHILSLLPSNDALPVSKDHSERSEGEGGGGKAATDEVCQSASSSGPGTAASLTSCPKCKSWDPGLCCWMGSVAHEWHGPRRCCPDPFHHPAPGPEAR